MTEREQDNHGFSPEFEAALSQDRLYAEILIRCGMFQNDPVPGGDETELRGFVSLFLAGRAGAIFPDAEKGASSLVPYYDGFARHRINGEVANTVLPAIFTRGVVHLGMAGRKEDYDALFAAHSSAGLTARSTKPRSSIHASVEKSVKPLLGARLMATAEQLSVTRDPKSGESQNFRQLVTDLTQKELVDQLQRPRLIRYAETGRMQSLPFRLFRNL